MNLYGDIILHEMKKMKDKMELKKAHNIAYGLIKKFKLKYISPWTINPDQKGETGWGIPVGSIRRKVDWISDIDILATSKVEFSKIEKIEGFNDWIEKGTEKIGFLFTCPVYKIQRKIEIYFVNDLKCFGGMLLFSTGPKTYNIALRKLAKDQEYILNNCGVFDKNGKQLGGWSEESIYKVLKSTKFPKGKVWNPPWNRGE